MSTQFSLIHPQFEPFREDLTSLRLNNGPRLERVGPRGRGQKEINAVWHSAPLQRPPDVWFESRLLGLALCLNMGRVIRQGSSDLGAAHQAAFEERNWCRADLESHLSKQICFKKKKEREREGENPFGEIAWEMWEQRRNYVFRILDSWRGQRKQCVDIILGSGYLVNIFHCLSLKGEVELKNLQTKFRWLSEIFLALW